MSEHQQPASTTILLSIEETCHLLGIGRTTVWRLTKDGSLDRVPIGRRTMITRQSIERFVKQMTSSVS